MLLYICRKQEGIDSNGLKQGATDHLAVENRPQDYNENRSPLALGKLMMFTPNRAE